MKDLVLEKADKMEKLLKQAAEFLPRIRIMRL